MAHVCGSMPHYFWQLHKSLNFWKSALQPYCCLNNYQPAGPNSMMTEVLSDVLITVVIRTRCQLGRRTSLPIEGFSLSSGLGYIHCISTSLVEVFQFLYHSLRAVPVCSCSLFRRTHKTYSISWEGTVPFQFKLTGRTRSVLSLLYTAVFPESYS